jgi:iron complex transport system substrate-binding protein
MECVVRRHRDQGIFVLVMLALFCVFGRHQAVAQTKERFVSINMCTDQMLLDLARPEQILGLSPFARDSARSWAFKQAAALPILSGTAEEVMMLKPDIVLAGRFTKRTTREFIRARGIRTEEFDAVRTIAESRQQIARIAALVGAQDLGRQRIAAMDEAFLKLKAAPAGTQLRVLPLSRRGWVTGQESLTSDLLKTAGLVNVAGEIGLRSGGFLTLEAIVKLRPDAILLSRDDGAAEDQGRAKLLHPAIANLFPPERRIVIPESLTVCGGPMLIATMERLATQIANLKPRDAAPR